MTLWDAPNQQVVRDDASAPWEEGTGGEEGTPVARKEKAGNGDEVNLDEMTKAELLEHAVRLGVTPANNTMTKDEIRASIDEAGS